MSAKRRMLWHSNAPFAPTGYGNQTGLFTPHVAQHYDLAISSFYGLEGARIVWNDIPVLPAINDGSYGNSTLFDHARRWFEGDPRSGMIVTLMDVWVLDEESIAKTNTVAWVPVDHEPAPPLVLKFFKESGAIPLAMSRFGQKMLQDQGLDPLYAPHGVDTDALQPHPREDVRKQVGVSEDQFLIGMVAANKGRPSRKGFQQALQAFRLFVESHPDAVLYLHTVMDPNYGQGEHLFAIIESLGIPADNVRIADQYRMKLDPYSPGVMARIYSAMDVLLNPALGEGFGITPLEAQACGTPVIVTDFSAMAEVGLAGWKVSHKPYWTGQQSWQAVPDVEDIYDALRQCYGLSAGGRRELSAKARKHALKYSVPRVFENEFLPALREAERRFEQREPVTLAAAA